MDTQRKIVSKEEWNIFYVKGFSKKIVIVVIWVMISLGVYQCSVQLSDTAEDVPEKAGEDGQDKKNSGKTSGDVMDMEEKIVPETPFDENVRILLMTQGYRGIYHTELHIVSSEGMVTEENGILSDIAPDSEYVLSAGELQEGGRITITAKNNGRLQISNIGRNSPAQYRGRLECYPTAAGIVVVNELPVEEYLYGVVPSEMPSAYPAEALKAQAVSARTYTYFHKKNYAYPEWRAHMDDSTTFQVYMNCGETPETIKAVDATRDQVLTYEGELVESFYYSTSSGYNGGAAVWKETLAGDTGSGYLVESGEELYASNSAEGELAYQQYIDVGNAEDVEYCEAWYRWTFDRMLDSGAVKKMMQKLYQMSQSQPAKVRIRSQYLSSDQLQNESEIRDIRVLNRKKSGMVAGIMIETAHFRVSVMSQHMIRQALGCANAVISKKDGSSYIMGELLPSAYFYIEKIYDNNGESGDNLKQIIIHGAGFGHGCGMSQNGAKGLAEKGLTAEQILAYYYNGNIKAVGELGAAAG